MKFILNIVITFILFIILTSCYINNNKPNFSYFGGQIVNPKSTKVYFLKNDKFIDSATLNKHNKFLIKLKNLKSGLYSFSHGREYQYVYFNTTDSIIIRLNTWDFDESLVFSGKGAERNNFLLNLFLSNENEDKLFRAYYKLNPNNFNTKIDSVLKIKLYLYNQFKTNNKQTPVYFNKLVNVAISYPLFRKKENYPLYHKRYLKAAKYPIIDNSFYNFRKKINFNDSSLVYFYPYRNYINSFLHHNAYLKKLVLPNSNVAQNIIENIIKTIHQKQLKNFFLYRVVSDSFFYYNLTDNQRNTILNLFYKNCDDDKLKSEIKQLASDFNNIKKGKKLFDFKIINVKGKKLNASSVLKNNKTVLYFWSNSVINTNNLSKRILYLQKRYPNLNFIGINMDTSKESWLKSSIFKFLNPKNQYKLTQKCVMRNFITAKTPRIILLNDNAVVKNGFTVFWAEKFNNELEQLNKN